MHHAPGSPAKFVTLVLACVLGLLGVLATLSRVDGVTGLIPFLDTGRAKESTPRHQPTVLSIPGPMGADSWIAFSVSGEHGRSPLYVVAPDGFPLQEVYPDLPQGTNREWSKDGHSILLCTPFDHLDGGPGSPCTDAPSVTPNLRNPPSLTYFDSRPRRSPDGRTLAFVRVHDADPNRAALMTVDILSGVSSELVEFGANVQLGIDWSPDGRQVVYTSKPRGGSATNVWIAAVDGSGTRQLTHLDQGWTASSPTYSPDGGRIAMTLRAGDRAGIAVADTAGGKPTIVVGISTMRPRDLDWGPALRQR
jgi:Tol biopolymer transport system component